MMITILMMAFTIAEANEVSVVTTKGKSVNLDFSEAIRACAEIDSKKNEFDFKTPNGEGSVTFANPRILYRAKLLPLYTNNHNSYGYVSCHGYCKNQGFAHATAYESLKIEEDTYMVSLSNDGDISDADTYPAGKEHFAVESCTCKGSPSSKKR